MPRRSNAHTSPAWLLSAYPPPRHTMDSNSTISVSIEYCQLQRSFSWSSKPRRAPTEYDEAYQRVKRSIEETFPDARVTGNESPPAGANGSHLLLASGLGKVKRHLPTAAVSWTSHSILSHSSTTHDTTVPSNHILSLRPSAPCSPSLNSSPSSSLSTHTYPHTRIRPHDSACHQLERPKAPYLSWPPTAPPSPGRTAAFEITAACGTPASARSR